jgi:hypothetical protein
MNPVARLVAVLLLLTLLPAIPTSAKDAGHRIGRAALLDKIRGGWAGQMIGVSYGAPTEFKSNAKIGDWDLKWEPGMLDNAIQQDDLYVEMTFSKVMDDRGLGATSADYGRAFRDSQYHLWHANAGARRILGRVSCPPNPVTRGTTSTPTTSTSRSRPTSSGSCAPGSPAPRTSCATASAAS